jgi:hypothetical protein
MKKYFFALFLISSASLNAQELKNLVVNVMPSFNIQSTFFVEPLDVDKCSAIGFMKNSLSIAGYKVVADKTSADYSVAIMYTDRNDSGCGGRVMKNLTGQISDLKNGSIIVSTFSFSQGNLSGKCTSLIMEALAKEIKGKAPIK